MPKLKIVNENKILNDAMELFWENGFYKTSIQELVNNIDLNRTTLYNTYSDKEGLYKKSFYLYRENITQNIKRIFKKSKNTVDGFDIFTKYLVFELLKKKNGCLMINAFTELLPCKNHELEEMLNETRMMWINLISSLLRKAKKNNELIDNINILQASQSIYSLIAGIAVLSKTNIELEALVSSLNFIKKTIFK